MSSKRTSSKVRVDPKSRGTNKRQKPLYPVSNATSPSISVQSAHFFKLPLELRLSVYDILLAEVRPAMMRHRWYKRRDGQVTAMRDPLCLRYVNHQIADDTLQYLFRTFDLSWIIAECRPGEADELSVAIRGQWSCIHHFKADARYILQDRRRMPFQRNQVQRFTEAKPDAFRIHSTLERFD
ncbi:hypothetical protein LTR09_011904 [Extremus antarcticus]|uniref:Uncharacterized protein n=1 Tax=Extremus antarcticus TaxID=702011 RepID=A0AAJ0G463_9PEZI|nr:hypothetical protein LTR09_011904 [Extremus antarcticus]